MCTLRTGIIHRPVFYFFIFITAIEAYGDPASIWKQRQIQISNLFNFFCARNNDQLHAIQSPFDPLNYLSLYSNPNVVQSYTTAFHSGKLTPRAKSFIKGGVPRDEMIQLIEILYFIDVSTPHGWDLFYNTTAFYSIRVNVGQFYWAMGAIFSSKFFGYLLPPSFHETIPQFYTPKEEIRRMNGIPEPPPPPGGHVVPFDEPNYWLTDPLLGVFHFWWHADLENVLNDRKFGLLFDRKGELFLYAHHQIMARYIAERRSSGLRDIVPLSISSNFRIEKGYEANHLDVNFAEFSIRGSNTAFAPKGFANLVATEKVVYEAVDSGYAIHLNGQKVAIRQNPETFDSEIVGTDILGALLESSTQSVNLGYYKSLHGNLHENIAYIKDPRYPELVPNIGVQDHQEINMADPVFYQIHQYIDNILRRHKYLSPQIRTEEELFYHGVNLISMRIDRTAGEHHEKNNRQRQGLPFQGPQLLTTFFEEYSYDIINAVVDCRKLERGETFRTKRLRLNHHDFVYTLDVFLEKFPFQSENAIVRIFMSPLLGADGRPYTPDDLHWNMIEMDRFPIVLRPGWNRIQRSSQDSAVTGKKSVRACGWPQNLLLPKGTEQGLPMKMFVLLTPAGSRRGVTFTVENEKFYPAYTMCGHPYLPFPDDKPMGYPFDKKIQFNSFFGGLVRNKNYGFYDVIIKHLSHHR